MKPLKCILLLWALSVALFSCAPDGGVEDDTQSPDPVEPILFRSFTILKEKNPDAVLASVQVPTGETTIDHHTPLLIDRSSLVVDFVTDIPATVYVGDVEQVSGQTVNDFTSPVTYRMVGVEGDENECVVSLSSTGLPVVVINTPSSQSVPPKTEDWLEGTELCIYDAEGELVYNDEVEIRGRGNSTWTFPKKPYALKLNEKASILGMPAHKRWVLLANWLDRTLLRNDVAFHIASLSGLEWTPRGEFVEVILNGRHKGCYYLCEQIKVDKNRVNIAELSDADPSGGYLLELDVYYDEVFKFTSARWNFPYMFKDPDEVTDAQFAYMEGYVAELEEALYDDERFAAREYTDYLDVDSFVDFWLVFELTMNSEPFHPKSVYMHKDRGGVMKAGPVWDFDWETFVPYKASSYVVKEALYYARLFEDAAFVQRVKERWAELKPAFEGVPEYISALAEHIAHSEAINHQLWPIDVVVNRDEHLSFEEAVSLMRKSYENKLRWLGKQIEGM